MLGYCLLHVYFPEMPIRQAWLAWGDSDYSSFNRNGYPAVHPFEDVHASSPFIHSRNDVLGLSVNNLEQSKRFTELNLGLVATLAGINNDGVEETETINVAVYPNPTKESVNILTEDGMQHISVYNALGQLIETKEMNGENKCILNTNNYFPGIYFINIVTDKAVSVKRLVVR